jgi:signal peptidase I
MRSKRTKQLIGGLMIIVAAIAAKTFLIEHFRIPQNGMYPGLPAGSGFWAYKRAYSAPTQVKRGDIIVFTHLLQNGQPYIYIWRVMGLPGDTVFAARESLTINGRPVLRERIREEDSAVIFREKIDEATFEVAFAQTPKQRPPDISLTVPPDHFFVMGDNRFAAYDSRYFGPISFDSIIGKKL